MNSNIISSFFNRAKVLITPDSMLIKKLKYISMSNELLIYKDITIYHYSKSFDIPLLILDQKRGIYLFEYKEWSYDELKKSTIKKAHKQLKNRDTLAFEESQDVIRQQLFKLTQNDDIKIYNYLLMQNLNEQEYEHLDDSFKELLPKDKIMFNNSSNEDILKKLQDVSKPIETLPSASKIISALLVQYSIVDHDKTLQLATCEQMKFIDAKLSNHITLNAKVGSGKTSSILLKAVVEKLKNKNAVIIIIKPTLLSADILKKRLLATIDSINIEIDLTSIEILTPNELLNKHLKLINKKKIKHNIELEKYLMKKGDILRM